MRICAALAIAFMICGTYAYFAIQYRAEHTPAGRSTLNGEEGNG